MKTISELIGQSIDFINNTLVPLVFAIAFITFIWGIFQYFIAGGASEEKRQKGKDLLIYGLTGFFVMISIWGLVNLLVNSLNFNNTSRPCLPTYGKDAGCDGRSGTPNTSADDFLRDSLDPDGVGSGNPTTPSKPAAPANEDGPINPETGLPAIY